MIFKKCNYDHRGNRTENISEALHKEVGLAAVVTGDRTPDYTNEEVTYSYDDSENEGESRTVCKTSEDVLTGLGSTEDEVRLVNLILDYLTVLVVRVQSLTGQVVQVQLLLGASVS